MPISEPIGLCRWVWWRWPWRSAIILKARECRAGTLRGRQLRQARLEVLRDIHLRLPSIAPEPTSYYDVSPEEEWARRWDELPASLGNADTWHSLGMEAMAQGRGMDFAVREREYRDQAAEEVRDRAARLLDRLGAHAKAILRQPRYRVAGYRVEAGTGHVERNRTILTADDFAVFSVDLSNECFVAPGAGLKYAGVSVREFRSAESNSHDEVDLAVERGSVPSKPGQQVIISSEATAPVEDKVERLAERALPQTTPDDWFRDNFHKGDKRDPAIKACCVATGATWREGWAAYKRLPLGLRRTRGGRDHSR